MPMAQGDVLLCYSTEPSLCEMVNETQNTYYFDTDGKLAKIKDGNEINTTITRDANKITLVKDNETSPSVITLDSQGRVTSSIDYRGKENKFFYGANGELSKVENDEGRNVNYTYNLNKNISKIETDRGKVSYEHDDKNRITKETDSAGNSAILEYNDNYETGIITITRTDRNGNKSYITTDFFGNVLKTADALGYEANYIYDDNRNLIKIVDKNGNVSNRTFNDMNLITSLTDSEGISSSIDYDQNGNAIKIALQNGAVGNFDYDANNQVIKSVSASGAVVKFCHGSENESIYRSVI